MLGARAAAEHLPQHCWQRCTAKEEERCSKDSRTDHRCTPGQQAGSAAGRAGLACQVVLKDYDISSTQHSKPICGLQHMSSDVRERCRSLRLGEGSLEDGGLAAAVLVRQRVGQLREADGALAEVVIQL